MCPGRASSSAVADAEPYIIAGVDLRPFVSEWLAALESQDDEERGLLEHARNDPELHARYQYGAAYMMSNIGPQATKSTATTEELLLFAVLSVYQIDKFPGADHAAWDGEQEHVRRALAHSGALGEHEIARRLRQDVLQRSRRGRPRELDKMIQHSMNNDPARIAAHDRNLASIDSRTFRAAKLLDPDGEGEIDEELAALLS